MFLSPEPTLDDYESIVLDVVRSTPLSLQDERTVHHIIMAYAALKVAAMN